MTLERCNGHNKDGTPCSARAQAGNRYCPWHDPERADDRVEWRRKGGLGSSNRARARKAISDLRDLGTVQATILQAIEDVRTGKMEPPIAAALATLARALVAVAGVNAALTFEQRLEEMAHQIAELSERQPA